MQGGKAIASGSQACIFHPELRVRSEDARNIAYNSDVTDHITKVFYDRTTWANEIDILLRVHDILQGRGVIDIIDFGTANKLASIVPEAITGKGCRRIQERAAAGQDIYFLNQTFVVGDIRALKRNSKPLSFFKQALEALIILNYNGIIHMDMASRNVFYTEDAALIGDFGFGIDMNVDRLFDESLQTYFNTHMAGNSIEATIMNCFDFDAISYEAALGIVCYCRWDDKNALVSAYFSKETSDLLEDIDIEKRDPGYIILLNTIMRRIKAMTDRSELKPLLKLSLKNSDLKMFIVAALDKCDLEEDVKKELRVNFRVKENYRSFYTLLGTEPSDEISGMLAKLATQNLANRLKGLRVGGTCTRKRKRTRKTTRRN